MREKSRWIRITGENGRIKKHFGGRFNGTGLPLLRLIFASFPRYIVNILSFHQKFQWLLLHIPRKGRIYSSLCILNSSERIYFIPALGRTGDISIQGGQDCQNFSITCLLLPRVGNRSHALSIYMLFHMIS